MKFIVDAQLPRKLSYLLQEYGHDVIHTLDLPSQNLTKDSYINQLSLDEKRVVISKDLDFIESLLISNKPYKLLAISMGNVTNKVLLALFKKNIHIIVSAFEDTRLVEMSDSEIIVH